MEWLKDNSEQTSCKLYERISSRAYYKGASFLDIKILYLKASFYVH